MGLLCKEPPLQSWGAGRGTYQAGQGERRAIGSAHEESLQDHLVEGSIGATSKEPVELREGRDRQTDRDRSAQRHLQSVTYLSVDNSPRPQEIKIFSSLSHYDRDNVHHRLGGAHTVFVLNSSSLLSVLRSNNHFSTVQTPVQTHHNAEWDWSCSYLDQEPQVDVLTLRFFPVDLAVFVVSDIHSLRK